MVEWLELAVAVIGAVAVLWALLVGLRLPRPAEPSFALRFEDAEVDGDVLTAVLVADNPSEHPMTLRSLVIHNAGRGLFFLTRPADVHGEESDVVEESDVLTVDIGIAPESSEEIEFYVGRAERASARELLVEVEFSTAAEASIVKSQTVSARVPRPESTRRRVVLAREKAT